MAAEPIVTQQHFVTFYSPATFVAEDTRKPIDAWDVEMARAMAAEITERHGARPYGFRFTTRGRSASDLDSREITKSPFYYIKGRVETLAQVKARNDPADRILIGNMERNGYGRVITTVEGWKWTQPLRADDIVLEEAP